MADSECAATPIETPYFSGASITETEGASPEDPTRQTSFGSGAVPDPTLSRLNELRESCIIFRRRVSGTCVFLGVLCFVAGVVLSFIVPPEWFTRVAAWTATGSQAILLHGVLPFDQRAVLAVCFVAILLLLFGYYMYIRDLLETIPDFNTDNNVYFGCMLLRTISVLAFFTVMLSRLCYNMKVLQSAELLAFLWLVSRSFVCLQTFFYLLLSIAALVSNLPVQIVHKVSHLLVHAFCLFLLSDDVRLGTRELLAGQDVSLKAGAAVAGLMAGKNQMDVWTRAMRELRGIRCDKLTRQGMASQQPDSSLFALSTPACWGEVDAFLSHSWHDDADAKWQALQEWRNQFKDNIGREPVVWVDKYCIDQANIDHSLECLPVWLAECSRLLIIAGPTYLTRLWCIMELFIFLETGGSPAQVDLRIISETGQPPFAMLLNTFDAENATCFLDEDKRRLLSVVNGSYGSLGRFSTRVQQLLMQVLPQ